MWGIIEKIWYMIWIMPYYMVTEGYARLKKFLEKHNYKIDWLYVILAFLVFLLIILFLGGYR